MKREAKQPGHPEPAPEIVNAAASLLGVSPEQLKFALTQLNRPKPDDKLLSRKDAAKYLGIDYTTLKGWAAQGKIAQIKFGYKLAKYRLSDLDALIAANTKPAANAAEKAKES